MRTLLVPCCLLAVVLTGCGDPNAGDQKIADFTAWLAEHPVDGLGVESSEAQNALPWVGDGEVTLLVEEPLDLVTVAAHVCDYGTTHADVAFVAHVGAVLTPFDCEGDLREVEADVQALNDVRGLRSAVIGDDGSLTTTFGARWQLRDAVPALMGDHPEVTARTDGLAVLDDAYADEDVRDALAAQVTDLSPLVTSIAARADSGTTPGGLSVVTTTRPGPVRREMEALTPGVPITVVAD